VESLRAFAESWREGTSRSQWGILFGLCALVLVCLGVSFAADGFPLTGFLFWWFVGLLLLRFRQLLILAVVIGASGITSLVHLGDMNAMRWIAIVMFFCTLLLAIYTASRQLTGLPGTLSSALLLGLRNRLNAQGKVPALPAGWRCETAMASAHSAGYAGDFMVVDLQEEELTMVLVDVVGKGLRAAPSALMLAGAFGGMVGRLCPEDLLRAANAFLLRQESEDAFATAVCVSVDLGTGEYSVISAGHPPAFRYRADEPRWVMDSSRGLALGVLADPELEVSTGVLGRGEALMFYTDGVVESRGTDIEDGIAWLQDAAAQALARGFNGAARRVIARVPQGDDDRALLILSRPE